jgi:hypothetical protein
LFLWPTTPTRTDELPDFTRWQLWWSYNHDPYLDFRARVAAVSVSSGVERNDEQRRELRAEVVTHLTAVVDAGGKTWLLRQALFALARLGDERDVASSVHLDRQVQSYLVCDRPELQEAAILALGVRGTPTCVGLLCDLLHDDEDGRSAMGSRPVTARNRAFAAFALGLIGAEQGSQRARLEIVHALLSVLGKDDATDREIRVASVLALGLIPLEAALEAGQSSHPSMQVDGAHLCGGDQIDYLVQILRDARLDPWVRGHAATALGRLGRMAGEGREECEEHPAILSRQQIALELVDMLEEAKGNPPVLHGIVIAMGLIADADDEVGDEAVRKCLVRLVKRGDRLTQHLALAALGEILGRPTSSEPDPESIAETRSLLMRELARTRGSRRAWSALALAIADFGAQSWGWCASAELPFALRTSLARTRDPGDAAAFSLALAILRDEHPDTREVLSRRYAKLEDEAFRDEAALAMGWLGARGDFEKELGDARSSLRQTLRAATALRLAGDSEVVPVLLERLRDSEEPRERLGILRLLARLDVLEAGETLIQILVDEDENYVLRASAAWALGGLCDSDSVDWSAMYANDLDYPYLTWTLSSPLGDGYGLLDGR